MNAKSVFARVAGIVLATAPLAAAEETVRLELRSPQAGQSVEPGAAVTWEIWARVTSAGNQGLALVSVDFAQDAANPARFDLPPAQGVPAAMAQFSRPAGISNPGENGNTTGYVGVQRGAAGQRNLVQIGGSQNTFGVAVLSDVGTDPNVVANVGKDADVMIASGTFAAPATNGTYVFRLQNPLANVIAAVNAPPEFSPVVGASITLSPASIGFTVSPIRRGDANCDGAVDFDDINPFVAALVDPGSACKRDNCDTNCDGGVDFADINAFVSCLVGKCPCP